MASGPSDLPWHWLICVVLGLALTVVALLRQLPDMARATAFITGQVVLLTAPFAAIWPTLVIGSWPTIDKTGSLLFYLDGVHQRMVLSPIESLADPAARLIGVHVGHLWLVEALDVAVEPIAAFNLQGLAWVVLGWLGATLLARSLSTSWWNAVLVGFPFGMGLHVFRDLNWYTIEKAAVGLLAVFAWTLVRAWQDGGRWRIWAAVAYVVMAWINWYLALVGAAGAALALVVVLAFDRGRAKDLALTCLACSVAVLPLVIWQMLLLRGESTLGDPDVFLYERAMLDSFTLTPPAWNRMEIWRAVNLPVVGLAIWACRSDRTSRGLGLVALGLFSLALGPQIVEGVWNPVYMAIRAVIPGFWRVAKPEVFFEGTYLCLIGMAARGLPRELPKWAYLLLAAGWFIVVRSHPVYPPVTEYSEHELDPRWMEHLGGPHQ
ncbi:MAG: hypothetical protein GY884_34400 [Proteobacteria bacterium]|nr:hypothetical protein [Pseudomonadota bacterium]